jgi:CTP:molybdopterin cytidylyltransferase MocA
LRAAVAQTTDARFVAAPSGLADKLRGGCEALGWPAKVLMCAADSPLVSAQGLQQLMDDVVQRDLELGYPIVPREDCEARFPGGHRTYVKMRDGVFTGGNFLVLSGAIVRDRSEWIDRFFEARKSPFRLASLLGWNLVLRMFLGGVTVSQAEAYFTRRFGLRAAAVVCHDAGMGFDVDKPEDLELMVRITA